MSRSSDITPRLFPGASYPTSAPVCNTSVDIICFPTKPEKAPSSWLFWVSRALTIMSSLPLSFFILSIGFTTLTTTSPTPLACDAFALSLTGSDICGHFWVSTTDFCYELMMRGVLRSWFYLVTPLSVLTLNYCLFCWEKGDTERTEMPLTVPRLIGIAVAFEFLLREDFFWQRFGRLIA